VEGHALLNHVYMVLSIPPKLSVAMAMGYLKGKSAIPIHREVLNVKQGFTGKHFWSRGYCLSTVGLDEPMIRAYVKNQEDLDRSGGLV
jgi:putative transposase